MFEEEEETIEDKRLQRKKAKINSQIMNLHKKLQNLTLKRCDSRAEPEQKSEAPFEIFINDYLEEIFRVNKEMQEIKLEYFKKMGTKKLKNCLRFFKGIDEYEKRIKLIRFLKRAPIFKTKDIKLLEERLYKIKKWMRAKNITCKLEDVPLNYSLEKEIPNLIAK